MSGVILLDNVNVNTTSAEIEFGGGSKVIVVRGDDFGGGTLNLEVKSNNDSRFETIESFTDNATKKLLSTVSGLTFRADLINATNPINVFLELV